jgi:DNA-binding protein HU-beta
MNKADLINEMAKVMDSRQEAKAALDSMLDGMTTTLKSGGNVTLTGFGTFRTVHRKARTGVNPRTGEKIKIAAGKAVKFTPGKKLRGAA